MTLGELLRIGDTVVVTVDREARDWGYNPCPDGTRAEVIGFGEIDHDRRRQFDREPGIYVNKSWVTIRLEDGKEIHLGHWNLDLADKDLEKQRSAEYRAAGGFGPGWQRTLIRLRDLPETPFWEGDRVRARAVSPLVVSVPAMKDEETGRKPDEFVVCRIDYFRLNKKTMHGGAWPAYEISSSMDAGWWTSARAEDLTLIERGAIWKSAHVE